MCLFTVCDYVSDLVGVLEETDDVLVNVNIIEAEKASRNIDLRRKKPTYNPYEDMDSNEVYHILS